MRRFSLYLLFFLVQSYCLASQGHEIWNEGKALDRLLKGKLNAGNFFGDSSGIKEELIEDLDEAQMTTAIPPQRGLKDRDKIGWLPGQPAGSGIEHYGGYVTVNAAAGRAFYYYFVEAEDPKKHTLPLLLWLNGGPGCSSLGFGAMQEIGPFRVDSDGKTLYKNTYAWTTAVNVLFLESPAGVGFSYSNSSSDYKNNGDKRTARDNYLFLLNWMEQFPEFKNRDFFISGESYAGYYIPELAQTIVKYNKRAKKTIINLKGIMLGNPVLNSETDQMGMYDFWATHALTSERTVRNIHKYCNFSSLNDYPKKCADAIDKASSDLEYIDTANIYAPSCFRSKPTQFRSTNPSVLKHDPCNGIDVTAYLNQPDVQLAIHANVTKLKYMWSSCSEVITGWTDRRETVLPILQQLMANEIRVWLFSGDIDGIVPFTATSYALDKLKLSVEIPWRAWYTDNEVGGYTEVYKGNLTFVTIREAGHMVPSYQPKRVLSIFTHFLNNTLLPYPPKTD